MISRLGMKVLIAIGIEVLTAKNKRFKPMFNKDI